MAASFSCVSRGRTSTPSFLPYSNRRLPVTESMRATGPGPTARTVREPGATSVRPASRTTWVGRPWGLGGGGFSGWVWVVWGWVWWADGWVDGGGPIPCALVCPFSISFFTPMSYTSASIHPPTHPPTHSSFPLTDGRSCALQHLEGGQVGALEGNHGLTCWVGGCVGWRGKRLGCRAFGRSGGWVGG